MVKALLQHLNNKRRAFYEKYERVLVPGLLIGGFVVDVITFKSLQLETTLLINGIYAILAGLGIVYGHIFDGGKIPANKFFQNLRLASTFGTQFSFGSLLSTSFLFYWFSGAFFVSWPILILIVLLMVTSEFFRHIYLRPIVQLSVYTFVLFSYASLLLPYTLHSLSVWVFLLSGFLSVLVVLLITEFIFHFVPLLKTDRRFIIGAVLAVAGVLNLFYFLNIIPPIPLTLREAGVYHNITVSGGEYTLTGDSETLLQRLIPGQVITATAADKVFVYTVISAPSELSTTIYHRWQFYDPEQGKWLTRDRIAYTIFGGRSQGYRGYTFKSHLTPGKWRVIVETSRGQVLGRVPFTVVLP